MPFVRDGIAHIPLQASKRHQRWFALVDLEDMERVAAIKWMGFRSGRTIYVKATSGKYLAKHHENLTNFIMRGEPGQRFDHENGNGLDNRKANLRPATEGQNARNTLKTDSPHVTSRFKGVMLTSSGRWAASVTFEGNISVLGMFDDEADAARAYDAAAIRLFGEFAKTNAMMGLYENTAPVRNLNGQNADVRQMGEYVPAAPGLSPWQDVAGVNNPERQRLSPVVALKRHHRLKHILYVLADGTTVAPKAYIGPPVPEADLARMAQEMRAPKAA